MRDQDENKECLISKLQALRNRIIKSDKAHHRQKEVLALLSEINNEWEQGRFTPRQGFWRWNVISGEVTFRVENTRDDGIEELRDQFRGTWEGIVHPEYLDWVMKKLRSIDLSSKSFGVVDFKTKDQAWLRIVVDTVDQSSDGTVITVTGLHWDCTPFFKPFSRFDFDTADPVAATLEDFFSDRLIKITRCNRLGISIASNYHLLEEGHAKLLNEYKRVSEKYVEIFELHWKVPEEYWKVLEARREVIGKRGKLVDAIRNDLEKQVKILEEQLKWDPETGCSNALPLMLARSKLDNFVEDRWEELEEHWRDLKEHWKLVEVVYLLLHSHWDWAAHKGHSTPVTLLLFYATHRPDAAVFVKDDYMRYTYVSPALTSFLNISASNLLGRTDSEVFGDAGEWRIEPLVELTNLRGERMFCVSSLARQVDKENLGERILLMSLGGYRETYQNRHEGRKGHMGVATGPGLELMDESQPGLNAYKSKAMRDVMKIAHIAAKHHSTVLLTGESGSGKDYLARYIHEHSERSTGPYFSVNCASIAASLAESELFGHERGSFTGAVGTKRGLLELAEGGTLLLNEIGEFPLTLQTKLLTFLDTKTVTRVGAEEEIPVNVRLIAATNRDLEKEIEAGSFRQDLFYRLNVMPISVPPLRERQEDIPMLVQEILHKLCTNLQYAEPPIITPSTMKAFQAYHWPGNVRELHNVLERALILSGGARVDIASLGSHLDETTPHGQLICPIDSLPRIARPHGDMSRRPIDPGRDVLQVLKQKYIIDGKWSIGQLAKAMNIDRTTLSKWFKNHGLAEPFS